MAIVYYIILKYTDTCSNRSIFNPRSYTESSNTTLWCTFGTDGIRFFGGINACPVNSEKNIYLFRDFTWNVLYTLFGPKKKCE